MFIQMIFKLSSISFPYKMRKKRKYRILINIYLFIQLGAKSKIIGIGSDFFITYMITTRKSSQMSLLRGIDNQYNNSTRCSNQKTVKIFNRIQKDEFNFRTYRLCSLSWRVYEQVCLCVLAKELCKRHLEMLWKI